MDVLLKYGKIEQCRVNALTPNTQPSGLQGVGPSFNQNSLTKRTKSSTLIYHFIRLIFPNSLVQSISALALLK